MSVNHNRVQYYRDKVAEGVDHRLLFAGMIETIAVGSEELERLTETDTRDLKELAKAYRAFEDERLRKITEGIRNDR